jgi:hypothetical protein
MRLQSISSWRSVHAGSCHAWPLPVDATCASVARHVFKDAVAELGLEAELLEDCVLMASELAANTLHAQVVVRAGGGGNRLASVSPDVEGEPTRSAGPAPHVPRGHHAPRGQHAHRARPPAQAAAPAAVLLAAPTPVTLPAARPAPESQPELWLYLRGLGARRELVCKVFDSSRGWRHGAPPSTSRAPWMAVTGRGLQLVEELSSGRWGYHLTRSRLGGWGLRGKAVWFAVPAPLAHARLVDVTGLRAYTDSADVTAARASERLSARQAARELEAMLDGRGFGGTLVRDDRPAHDMSILSICRGLTVWCRSGIVSLTTPAGSSHRWQYADLVEAAEQTVRHFEELDLERDLARAQ